MSLKIQFDHIGGPEVLQFIQAEDTPPGRGEVRIRHTAIGLNFIDTYYRSGLYPVTLPSGLGQEAVGIVEAMGADVDFLAQGDRVAYASGSPGAYSEVRNIPAALLVKLPDAICDEVAASCLLQGMTVEYLVQRTFPVHSGQTVLWHAAAGGVGQIAIQWLISLGVTVIGTVGSDSKMQLAKQLGCHHVINYRVENFVERVREITSGAGVPVVYDSVGKDTFDGSLNCLSRRGVLVSFGNASGAIEAFSPLLLSQKGSLYLTRPKLGDYISTREELVTSANTLFAKIAQGDIKITPSRRYALADVKQAHIDLESRQTTGSLILLPTI